MSDLPRVADGPAASSATRFDAACALVVGAEGGYSADPRDAGNWTGGAVYSGELRGTKFGISAAAYPTLDIKGLTLADAQAIYRRDYWGHMQCDALPAPVALLVFDAAVNQGVWPATRFLQAAADVRQDGEIGPETLAAVGVVDVLTLVGELAWHRDRSYHEDATWMLYGHGWITRLARMVAISLVYDQPGAVLRWVPHVGSVL